MREGGTVNRDALPPATRARTTHPRRWPAILGLILAPAGLFPPGAAGAGPRVPTCAILAESAANPAAGATLPVVEARLLGMGGVTFVERAEVEKLLRERQLQALLGPEAGTGRAAAGRLLKADLLVLLRGADAPKPHIDVVACETAGGLRLCNLPVPLSGDPQADAEQVGRIVARVFRERGGAIRGVVAVPPFVSNDLTYDFDYLRSGYAQLIERMLTERAGVVLVELAEARAIGREQAVAGGPGVERALPLYLLGEYRHEGSGDRRTVRIDLTLKRGAKAVASLASGPIPPTDAAEFLRGGVGRLVDGAIGTRPPEPDPQAEAKELAARAETYQRLENWEEAAALLEASLLLDPGDIEVRHQAVIVAGRLASRSPRQGGRPSLDEARRSVAEFFRGMEHLEFFLRRVGDLRPFQQAGQSNFIAQFLNTGFGLVIQRHPDPEIAAVQAEGERRYREALLGLARLRARDRRGDEAYYLSSALSLRPQAERFDAAIRMLEELRDLPGAARRVNQFGTGGYSPDILGTPEGRRYLDRVAALPDPEARAEAARLKASLAGFDEQAAKHKVFFDSVMKPVAADPGEQDVAFRRLELPLDGAPGIIRPIRDIQGCIPAGGGVDAFWGQGSVFLMKEKGRLRRAWFAGEANASPSALCFDGRYVWAAIQRHAKAPRLIVIDPRGGEVGEIAREDGLPGVEDQRRDLFVTESLSLAPIAPGRVLLAGFFGRTYLAVATYGAEAGKSVKVFHEAREAPNNEDAEQWRRTTAHFQPGYLLTIDGRPGPGRPVERRMLIGRSPPNIESCYHPLLVDPGRLTVEVLQDKVNPGVQASFGVHDGGAFWAWPAQRRDGNQTILPDLWRVGFPDFKRTRVAGALFEGKCERYSVAFRGDGVLVASDRLCTAESPRGPYRRLAGVLPDARPTSSPALLASNHYGILLKMDQSAVYRVEFRGESGAKSPRPADPGDPR